MFFFTNLLALQCLHFPRKLSCYCKNYITSGNYSRKLSLVTPLAYVSLLYRKLLPLSFLLPVIARI
ncbi:hypothetical protein C7212DRAFT_309054 [Tuber magnatum]|uniref:Uncharacterized protein n=1 Tax=Tuber magnatum TaxID=42249 RepID=A0A317SW36_9PEZI|nr:hypothetical protein C7212DRAFT_309054 [Tuber magnatum]